MKTPMQELIEYKHQLILERGQELSTYEVLNLVISKAESLLEKEEEVIKDAVKYGFLGLEKIISAQEYYNKTFKTNKPTIIDLCYRDLQQYGIESD